MSRRRRRKNESISVEMSSLIDCVFLLLIFFLVTTMMKKLEKQIPVAVPDNTVMVADKADAQREIIGVDDEGGYFRAQGREFDGRPKFVRVSDIDEYLDGLAEKNLKEKDGINIRLYADANVEFQRVIDLLDKLQIKKLDKVDVRMRDHRQDTWYRGLRKGW